MTLVDMLLRIVFILLGLFFLSMLVIVCIVVIKTALDDRKGNKDVHPVQKNRL